VVDVEDMIGELEDDDTSEDGEASSEEQEKDTEEQEETFGLDLDSAWSSPDRTED
jgi:hypothetical protein